MSWLYALAYFLYPSGVFQEYVSSHSYTVLAIESASSHPPLVDCDLRRAFDRNSQACDRGRLQLRTSDTESAILELSKPGKEAELRDLLYQLDHGLLIGRFLQRDYMLSCVVRLDGREVHYEF
jgi:hypothetical protein